jgi:hypothetical protein
MVRVSAKASHVFRPLRVPHHNVRDVMICVATATYMTCGLKRWHGLYYHREFKGGGTHMPKACPISCANTPME